MKTLKQIFNSKISLLALTLVAGAFLLVPATVLAVEDGQTTESDQQITEQKKKELELKKEKAKKEAEKKREAAKKEAEKKKSEAEANREKSKKAAEELKKACENKRESFKKRMESLASRGNKRLEIMDKTMQRIETFKSEKNLNVENYDALLADVTAKKEALHDAHEVAKELADDFDCDKENGTIDVLAFRDAVQKEAAALKEYRTSLKKLIEAVKKAALAQNNEENNEIQQ